MDSIQYYHDMANNKTWAVEVSFNKEDLLDCVCQFHRPVLFNIGFSKVHPNDQYTKKIGRQVANENIKPVKTYFHQMDKALTSPEKVLLTFRDDNDIIYTFRLNAKSEKPHLIYVGVDVFMSWDNT